MSWIRVNHKLPDTRQVGKIAKALSIPESHVVGCLSMVWIWFDIHAKSGRLVTRDIDDVLAMIDDDLSVPGFCRAMQSAKWMVIEAGAIVLPEFESRQGRSNRHREQDRERQRRKRSKAKDMVQLPASVTRDNQGVTVESRVIAYDETTWPDGILNADSVDVTRESRVCHGVTSPPSPSLSLLSPTPPILSHPPTPAPRVPRTHEATPTREQLAQMVIPTTDEIQADVRKQFLKQINQSWESVISFIGGKNSGAERYTPESWAIAYIDRAATRDLTAYHPQNKGNRLSPINWMADLKGFMDDKIDRKDSRGLVLRNAPAAKHTGPISEPSDWKSWPCFSHYRDWHWSEIPDDVRRTEIRKRSELLPS